MCIPYMKMFNSDEACLITDKNGQSFEKRKCKFQEYIKDGNNMLGEIEV